MAGERLIRSGSISLIGSMFAALAALALTVLVGNGFGAYGTGIFFQAIGIFTIASHVLRLGTNSSIVRTLSEQTAHGRAGESWRTVVIAVLPVLALSLLGAALMLIFDSELAGWLSAPTERRSLATVIAAMAPFLAFGALLAVMGTVNRMLNGVTAFTVIQSVAVPVSRLVAVAAAVLLAWGAAEAFLAWLAVIPIWLVVSVALVVKPLIRDWKRRSAAREPTLAAAARFWSYSSSRAVGGTFEILLEWSDVLIVAALTPPAEAGIYAVATRTIRVGQIVDRAMRVAVSPTIAQMLTRGELVAARQLHTAVTRVMILATWPYYLILATLGPAVLSLFGSGFAEGAVVLAVLATSMMLASAGGMLQSLLLQGGRSSWQMYNKGLALTLSVGLNLLLVPLWGILGAAVTWALVIAIDALLAAWQVHKRMGVRLEPRKLLLSMFIPVIVFGLGGAAVRLGTDSSLLVSIAGTGLLLALYAVVLWLLRDRLGIADVWSQLPVVGRLVARRGRSATKESGQRPTSAP